MKTRVKSLDGGAKEVIRLLSPDDLDSWSQAEPLSFEKSIVWLEGYDRLPFVRVKTVKSARSRRGPINLGENLRVVGYSKLTTDAAPDPNSGGYVRRVFYLKPSDTERQASAIHGTMVDPRTVLPGLTGELVEG